MAATIYDVSRLAKVSVATVSRAINNSASVSSEKKKRIKNAIKALDYKPNIIAQSLVNKRLKNIAIVLTRSPQDAFVSPYYSIMMSGFGNKLEDSGYEALLVFAKDEETEIRKCVSLIDAGTIQGIIVLGSRVYDRLINKLIEIKFPFVLIGRIHPQSIPENVEVDFVNTDSIADSTMAVQFLLDNGHKKIGLIHSPLKYMVNQDRHDGYVYAMKKADIPLNLNYIIDGGYAPADAIHAANELLLLDDPPTAVFCTDDIKAIAFIQCANQLGYRVPDDFSVVGHNNYDHAALSVPALTTVEIPMLETAEQAASIILDAIQNPEHKVQNYMLPSKFIQRNSVKCIRIK